MKKVIQFYPAHAEGEFGSPEAAFEAARLRGERVKKAIVGAAWADEFVAIISQIGQGYCPLVTKRLGPPATFVLWRAFVGHRGSAEDALGLVAEMSMSVPGMWAVFTIAATRGSKRRGRQTC
jgi:hypothetical protein